MGINGRRIKKAITKGAVFMAVTGAVASNNPSTVSNLSRVYAASNIETSKKTALKDLEKLYKTYNKKYYSSKEYKKLTNYYNTGIKKINECTVLEELETIYTEYETKLKNIKPSVLVKYQKKVEKSFLKTYKSMVNSNEYSEYNLKVLESIKDECIENIYAAKNKTNVKKVKSTYVNKLKEVKTLLDETKNQIISYIKYSGKVNESEKQTIINNINNSNDINYITNIGKEYGYVKGEIVTKADIEQQIKDLTKKYKAYTEDEIRILVANTNLSYIKDEDLLDIYNVKDKDELISKIEKADELLKEAGQTISTEYLTRYYEENYYTNDQKKYKDVIWVNDLIIQKDLKRHSDYICGLIKTYIEKDCTKTELSDSKKAYKNEGITAMYIFETWYYGYEYDYVISNYYYDTTLAIYAFDDVFKGSEGYALDSFMYYSLKNTLNYRANAFTKQNDKREYGTLSRDLRYAFMNNSFLSNEISKIKNKTLRK